MKTNLVIITPDRAREMLEHNIYNNRVIREDTVAQYARDMRNGDWKTTHQGIAFNKNGDLVDGQHRLRAIIEANTSVAMLVSTDVDNETATLIDSGVGRTLKDRMGFATDDPVYKCGWIVSMFRCLALTQLHYPEKYKFSSSEMIELINRWYPIASMIYNTFQDSLHRHMRTAPYLVGLVSALAAGVDPLAVKAFDAIVSYGMIITDVDKYNYQNANRYRHWFDSPMRSVAGSVYKLKDTVRHTTDAVWCFVERKSKTAQEHYTITAGMLDQLAKVAPEKL